MSSNWRRLEKEIPKALVSLQIENVLTLFDSASFEVSGAQRRPQWNVHLEGKLTKRIPSCGKIVWTRTVNSTEDWRSIDSRHLCPSASPTRMIIKHSPLSERPSIVWSQIQSSTSKEIPVIKFLKPWHSRPLLIPYHIFNKLYVNGNIIKFKKGTRARHWQL